MYEPNKRKWNMNESWIGFSRIFGMQDFVGHNLYMERMGPWKWWNVRCDLLASRAKIVKHSKLKKCNVTRFIIVVGQLYVCPRNAHERNEKLFTIWHCNSVNVKPQGSFLLIHIGLFHTNESTSQIMHVPTSKNAWDIEKFKNVDQVLRKFNSIDHS
jgi:hypothetical protein